jgi:hypothetical protein
VRKIEVLHRPCRLILGRMSLAHPEKYQLETEPFTPGSGHITRVIPPFRAKIFVFEMVSWKLVVITRQRCTVLEIARKITARKGQNAKRKYYKPHRAERSRHPVTMCLHPLAEIR